MTFFFGAVPGHGLRQLARQGGQSLFKQLEIFRKCLYLMEILLGVTTQVLPREPSAGPGLVKRMAEQIMPGDTAIKFFF